MSDVDILYTVNVWWYIIYTVHIWWYIIYTVRIWWYVIRSTCLMMIYYIQ